MYGFDLMGDEYYICWLVYHLAYFVCKNIPPLCFLSIANQLAAADPLPVYFCTRAPLRALLVTFHKSQKHLLPTTTDVKF